MSAVWPDTGVRRRMAAVVLPDLLCELSAPETWNVGTGSKSPKPALILGVVLSSHPDRLLAVNERARRLGIDPGQTIAEAGAFAAELVVRELSLEQVSKALGRVAEVAMALGNPVAIDAPDTVWVDVTGIAHLWGGEAALAQELASRVRELGHRAQVVIANGPLLARALARWGGPHTSRGHAVPEERLSDELCVLPIIALPLDADSASWLMRLGIATVGDLAKLPRSTLSVRLGSAADKILNLCQGRDDMPLVPYVPARVLIEEALWDDPMSGTEPLLFALRGLTSRISARLSGRAEAAQNLRLVIQCDRSIAELRGAPPSVELEIALASPLWKENELWRVIATRIERVRLTAPSIGMRLQVTEITQAPRRQLELSRLINAGEKPDAEALPVLLSELAADIGREHVGVLRILDSHRPELKSALSPVALVSTQPGAAPQPRRAPGKGGAKTLAKTHAGAKTPAKTGSRSTRAALHPGSLSPGALPGMPTRFLKEPVPIQAALRVGADLAIGRRWYSIDKVVFTQRLDAVEWWSHSTVARDYLKLTLRNPEGVLDVLVYVDRQTGRRFLQAVFD